MSKEMENMKQTESFSVVADENGGVVEIPSKAKKIRIENDNEHLFLRYHLKFSNPEATIIIMEPNKAVIYKDGVSSGVLNAGPHPLYSADEIQKKGFLFFKKKSLKEEILVDLVVYNPKLTYKGKWGTGMNRLIPSRDPETQIAIDYHGRGAFDLRIADVELFHTTLVGNDPNFDMEKLKERVVEFIFQEIRHEFADALSRLHLGYVDVARHEKEIADAIQPALSDKLCENYGLVVPQFAIDQFFIDDEKREEIETYLKTHREKIEYKKDAKELAEEIERLDDKQWEREKYLIGLRREDYAKYLEVVKILGINGVKAEPTRKNHYCSKCGAEVEPDASFCPKCGAQLKSVERVCPHCGKQIKSKGKYCPHCGKEL